jgi:uracil-DNA glycosylase
MHERVVSVNPQLEAGWLSVMQEEFKKEYFIHIKLFLQKEKAAGKIIYPPGHQIFNAFNSTPFDRVKCVIVGQDPYHGKGQANGLCFSVNRGIPIPPSLINIFKELQEDLGYPIPAHGDLTCWAREGVLLLNASLTVEANRPNSHAAIGWEKFTDAVIRTISSARRHVVFLLWGKFAQSKAALIDPSCHGILTAAHPSPYSAAYGFFGCRHFSRANAYLRAHGIEEINWEVR